MVVETDGKLGNLPVNWPKSGGPFQNGFITCFRCVCVQTITLHHFQYKEVRYYVLNSVLDYLMPSRRKQADGDVIH